MPWPSAARHGVCRGHGEQGTGLRQLPWAGPSGARRCLAASCRDRWLSLRRSHSTAGSPFLRCASHPWRHASPERALNAPCHLFSGRVALVARRERRGRPGLGHGVPCAQALAMGCDVPRPWPWGAMCPGPGHGVRCAQELADHPAPTSWPCCTGRPGPGHATSWAQTTGRPRPGPTTGRPGRIRCVGRGRGAGSLRRRWRSPCRRPGPRRPRSAASR